MTNKQTLLDLADKVERLDGPCREADAEVWGAVGWNKLFANTNPPPSFFTSSIDAAVSLVPDGSYLRNMSMTGNGTSDGEVWRVSVNVEKPRSIHNGDSPRLCNAIVAAALRARAAECES